MTTITTTCAGCGRPLAVPERYQGRDLKCPSCGRSFRVDAAPPSPAIAPIEPAAAPAAPVPRAPAAPISPAATPAAPAPVPEPFGEVSAQASEAPPAEPIATAPVFWRVRRIGVLSTGLMAAAIYAVLGLLVGLAVALAMVFPAAALRPLRGPFVGALAVVVLPVLYAAIGFVAGVVVAAVYNLAARWIGGVRILLD